MSSIELKINLLPSSNSSIRELVCTLQTVPSLCFMRNSYDASPPGSFMLLTALDITAMSSGRIFSRMILFMFMSASLPFQPNRNFASSLRRSISRLGRRYANIPQLRERIIWLIIVREFLSSMLRSSSSVTSL